jgi:NAD(P)-dependent dehydrogenase (short-subunit alcohol dehydrogenase family)
MFDLSGKAALICGGSGGLGKGIAASLAKAGANVVLSGRSKNKLDLAVDEVATQTDTKIIGIQADITKPRDVNFLINTTIDMFGKIDILVNSAGLNIRKPAIEVNEEDWDYLMNVQLKSVFFTCQQVAIHMIEKNIKGKIINLASLTSVIAPKNIVIYSIAKGGITQLTKGFAVELAEYGINVNAIGPGYFKTDLTRALFDDEDSYKKILYRIPMGRTGDLYSDIGGTAVFLASDEAQYITGQTIYVDGGWLAY